MVHTTTIKKKRGRPSKADIEAKRLAEEKERMEREAELKRNLKENPRIVLNRKPYTVNETIDKKSGTVKPTVSVNKTEKVKPVKKVNTERAVWESRDRASIEPKVISDDIVEEWLEFSMNQRTPEEIRHKVFTNPKAVCFSYLCRFCMMSEDFIIELSGLSSGVFENENVYNPEQAKILGSLLMIPKKGDREEIIRLFRSYQRKEIPLEKIPAEFRKLEPWIMMSIDNVTRDKVDWYYIEKYQNLSNEFRIKHKALLHPKASAVSAYEKDTLVEFDEEE